VPLLEILQVLVVAAVPIAGVVGFALNIATVRKLEVERTKLSLEIERMKLEAERANRVIVRADPDEIASVTGRGVDLNRLRAAILRNHDGRTSVPRDTFACFPEHTLILTPEGEVKISEIDLGTVVVAWSTQANAMKSTKIIKVIRATVDQLLTVNGRLSLTDSHHVLVHDGSSVAAGRLNMNDRLVSSTGTPIPVEKLETIHGATTVYNLETADDLPFVANGFVVGSYAHGAKTAA
jgi:hypothetical protein